MFKNSSRAVLNISQEYFCLIGAARQASDLVDTAGSTNFWREITSEIYIFEHSTDYFD